MNRTQSSRARERKLNRWLMTAFALVLFLGVIMQIAMMARLSAQSKQTFQAEKEARELTSRIDNLKLSLEQFHSHARITAMARQLGMQLPDETQLRVLRLPALAAGTNAQSAEVTGAGEMME